jgi:hypothetical protein
MKDKIKISLIVFLAVLLFATPLYADTAIDKVNKLEFKVDQLLRLIEVNTAKIDLLFKMVLGIKPEVNYYEETNITNTVIVEYAPHTDGPWTYQSYPESQYRRTGHTYNGITTYVVEKIKYCWDDGHTYMFIK